MDLDRCFVAVVVKAGREAIRLAVEKGVDEECLVGDGLVVWRFILDHLKQYNEVPDPAAIEGKVGIKLDDPPPGPAEFFIDEVLNRRLHEATREELLELSKLFKAGKPQETYAAFENSVRKLRGLNIGSSRTVELGTLGSSFLEYYEKIKAGYRGILTPWPSVNEATLGFWPEDFVLYVARLGVGKTWALLIIANHVWVTQKRRVLFVTTEMGREKIFQRWLAVRYRYPYNDLRHGRLGAFSENQMRDRLAQLEMTEGFRLIGGDFDFSMDSLEKAIEESEPDVVFVDGAYLLRMKGDNRIERAANSFDELKRTAKRNHVPLVASTQFNRQAGQKASSMGADKIALSDAAGWNADLIYGLVQTDDMRRDKRMIQLPLKFREGEGEEIETHWDFDTMNFEELPKGAHAGLAGPGGAGGAGPPGGGSGPSGGASGPTTNAPDPDPYGTGLLFNGDDDKDPVPF